MSIKQVGSEEELEAIFKSELSILFKQSTACAASGVAMEEMEIFAIGHPEVPVHVVDVLKQRPLSQKTAAYFRVEHQSPQVILIRDGAAVWHASHFGITAVNVTAALTSPQA
jgi:bacillithiol system protein YtxJ